MKVDDSRKILARGEIFEDEVRFHQLWRQYRAFEQEILKIFLEIFRIGNFGTNFAAPVCPFIYMRNMHIETSYRFFVGFLSDFNFKTHVT